MKYLGLAGSILFAWVLTVGFSPIWAPFSQIESSSYWAKSEKKVKKTKAPVKRERNSRRTYRV